MSEGVTCEREQASHNGKYDCCTISEHAHATPTLLVRPGLNELILSTVVDKILHAVVHGEDEVEQRVSARLQERGR